MEDISLPIFGNNNIVKIQTIFSVNDIQVIFNTDLKTATKLKDDEILKDYIQAVIQANLLEQYGIVSIAQVTSIERLDSCDEDKVVLALDIAINVHQGVEELRCCITEERIFNEIEEPSTSEDSSFSWNQQVPDLPSGPALRWNSEMTSLLIKVRGEMDREFAKAKYKFRLWEKVAAKLNSVLINIKVSAKDCDDKWRNIVATYRKNIDKLKCFGDNSVRWEYFLAMDKILKGTKGLPDSANNNKNEDSIIKLMDELNSSEIETKNEPFEVIDISTDPSPVGELEIENEEDLYQNVIITRKTNGEKRKWTTETCLYLIFLRHQFDSKFAESYENAPHLWKKLTVLMNETFFTDLSATELESVWNHLIINYEINLENLKSKGVNTIKWKYFAVLDEILGGTNEISDLCIPRPGENLLKEFNKLQLKNTTYPSNIGLSNSDHLCFSDGLINNLKDESDSEDAYSGVLWTRDMVKMLISFKKTVGQEILQNKLPRKKQWFIIVRRFRTLKNILVTEEGCEEKWKNLVRTYKKNLIRVKKKETNIKWPYFWKMREILGNSVLESEKRVPPQFFDFNSSYKIKSNCFSTADDDCMDSSEGIEDNLNKQYEHLLTVINEFRENQTKTLQKIFDTHNKVIKEIHEEQVNIKSLLTQLLQKIV